MKGPLTTALAGALLLLGASPATAGDGDWDGQNNDNGTVIHGSQGQQQATPGPVTPGVNHVNTGPPPPTYEHYWVPACSENGPPGQNADVMCSGAANACDYQGEPGQLYMQHWQRQVTPTRGDWEMVGTECRGGDEPTREDPQVTGDMVTDAAFAAAPRPQAMVQPGTRSYVNIPNNYYADAESVTVPVTVLGQNIDVRFEVTDVTWDFGDGATGSGAGAKDAGVGDPDAVEHAYLRQGSYSITANSTLSVSFTLPNGQAMSFPNAFTIPSETVVLPVSEIQTRVDSTG